MQKLEEAQDISEAVLDAEVKIGELMAKLPKASPNRGNQYTGGKTTAVSISQTKAKIIENAGFSVKQAQRFETLAKNPELVEQAKAECRHSRQIKGVAKRYHIQNALAHCFGA